MTIEGRSASVVLAIILGLTLAVGPLGPLSIPAATSESLGTGSANLSVESVPDTATLSAGTYTDLYYLDVPPAVVSVEDVRGSPLVTMSLTIDDLGYSRSSVFVLSEGMTGRHSFEIARDSLNVTGLGDTRLQGVLRMVLRDGTGERVLITHNVSVEVTG